MMRVNLTVGQVLKMKKSWIMIVNFGIYQFIINACMASMVAWFTICRHQRRHGSPLALWAVCSPAWAAWKAPASWFCSSATKRLSLGAIIGIPRRSFIFGVIDDKLGTLLPPGSGHHRVPARHRPDGSEELLLPPVPNVPMLVLWGFGVACMTGGVPTMHPASISLSPSAAASIRLLTVSSWLSS